ncbi:MAG: hypothetical protein ACE5HI_00425 [bacterium]
MRIKKWVPKLLIALLVTFLFNSLAQGQVRVVRRGQENPVVTIAKSTLYGAATGTLLGLALSLVVDEDTGDILKWSFVGGTFGGFLFGIYHVATRPGPSAALLQLNSKGRAKINLPSPEI